MEKYQQYEQPNSNKNKAPLVKIFMVFVILGVLLFSARTVARILLVKDMDNIIDHANDGARKMDLYDMSRVLRLAHTDGEITFYDTGRCNSCTSDVGSNVLDGSGWIKFKVNPGRQGIKKYFNDLIKDYGDKLPLDPTNKKPYVYTFASDGEDFELNAVFYDNDQEMVEDGGNNPNVYEVGTNLDLIR